MNKILLNDLYIIHRLHTDCLIVQELARELECSATAIYKSIERTEEKLECILLERQGRFSKEIDQQGREYINTIQMLDWDTLKLFLFPNKKTETKEPETGGFEL